MRFSDVYAEIGVGFIILFIALGYALHLKQQHAARPFPVPVEIH